MENLMIKPDSRVKFLWNIMNAIFMFIAVLGGFILITGAGEPILALILLAIWMVVLYLPFALYIPAYYRSLEFSLDSDAIRLKKGVFWRRVTTVPYAKITNIDITQGPLERAFHIYQLHVQTAGFSGNQATRAELLMVGISDPETLKEQIMNKLRGKAAPLAAADVPLKSDTQLLQAIVEELGLIRSELSKK